MFEAVPLLLGLASVVSGAYLAWKVGAYYDTMRRKL